MEDASLRRQNQFEVKLEVDLPGDRLCSWALSMPIQELEGAVSPGARCGIASQSSRGWGRQVDLEKSRSRGRVQNGKEASNCVGSARRLAFV